MPHLFSYGTLQQENVQLSTFKRKLQGQADCLTGFCEEYVEIRDPAVLAASRKKYHPILIYSGDTEDSVSGTVYLITDEELLLADQYEVADYMRVEVQLNSGLKAWVYVDKRFAPQNAA
ncbi:MAG: gamma-glutamylcyclotransferase [Alphaproteobacteria bacterium]|nr:gamma-glutamylcyclotransferase [Alphaproteobacteria bacterium]MBV8549594.1 gamma-glutamylcyclotransferase [Alphaproteobacteria bacterium]